MLWHYVRRGAQRCCKHCPSGMATKSTSAVHHNARWILREGTDSVCMTIGDWSTRSLPNENHLLTQVHLAGTLGTSGTYAGSGQQLLATSTTVVQQNLKHLSLHDSLGHVAAKGRGRHGAPHPRIGVLQSTLPRLSMHWYSIAMVVLHGAPWCSVVLHGAPWCSCCRRLSKQRAVQGNHPWIHAPSPTPACQSPPQLQLCCRLLGFCVTRGFPAFPMSVSRSPKPQLQQA